MTSRVLGLVRDQVLAFMFGAGNATDAFYVALRIPNLVRDLFAEGTMSAAFIPTFTRRLTEEGRDAAWQLGRYLITALIVITGVLGPGSNAHGPNEFLHLGMAKNLTGCMAHVMAIHAERGA